MNCMQAGEPDMRLDNTQRNTMGISEVEQLLGLFEASDFDELLIEVNGVRVCARRNAAGGTSPAPSAEPRTSESTSIQNEPQACAPLTPPKPRPNPVTETAEGVIAVRASIGGTFYRSPTPAADSFVEVGSSVAADEQVGLIEVMKLFTSVCAGTTGKVVEIIAENAAIVEAGEVLMHILPHTRNGMQE